MEQMLPGGWVALVWNVSDSANARSCSPSGVELSANTRSNKLLNPIFKLKDCPSQVFDVKLVRKLVNKKSVLNDRDTLKLRRIFKIFRHYLK